mgnify:CR=1 FL=1
MCGFAGYIHNYGTFDKEEVIHKMADRIKHRGPDDAHYYIDDGIALGFRRLSIIDLEGGRQPILNEDGSLVLLFNGEIYNYQELREELIKAGHVFTTKTDSETILHGYEEYGKKSLTVCAACLLSSSGTRTQKSSLVHAIFSASSRSITTKGQGIHVRQRDQKLSLSPEF